MSEQFRPDETLPPQRPREGAGQGVPSSTGDSGSQGDAGQSGDSAQSRDSKRDERASSPGSSEIEDSTSTNSPPSKSVDDSRRSASKASNAETRAIDTPGPDSGHEMLGPYFVEVKIGEGGMGKVYRCYDPTLKRRVAIKILHDRYVQDPRYKARFLREAQTVAGLTHPSLAQVYSIDTTDDRLSIVMEHVDGKSLDERIEIDGALEVNEALRILRQAAEGLAAAFEKDIVHRDIKPSNLLIDATGHVKIVDFGLAKELGGSNSITDEGIVLGTPQYLSPEQGRGLTVDQRSDIYSLGTTVYHLLTGAPPFDAKSQIAIIVAHTQDTPPSPSRENSAIPKAVSAVIGRMMAVDADDRYQTYEELITDVDQLLKGRPPIQAKLSTGRFSGEYIARAPRRRRWIAALVGVLCVSAIIGAVLKASSTPLVDLPQLGSWYIPGGDNQGLLSIDFGMPPAKLKKPLDKVFTFSSLALEENAQGPLITASGHLRWKNDRRAFACKHSFERIDGVQLYVHELRGSSDLGLALVHPDGNLKRELRLSLRSGESLANPIVALRGNEPVAIEGVQDLPRFHPPFEVFLSFKVHEDETDIALSLRKEKENDGPAQIHNSSFKVAGTDWSSGVLVLKSASHAQDFQVRIDRLVISGVPDGRVTQEVPWQD